MTKFLKYGGFLVLILILVLLAIPLLISLDHYKEDIKSKVKLETGRDLVIRDTIAFSFLPTPGIVLSAIELSGLPDEQDLPIIKVDKAKASLSILPLFTGNIVISEIVLENPIVHFEKLNNRNNLQKLKTESNSNPANTNDSIPFQIPKLPFSIKRLVIENGQITYVQNDNKTSFEQINLVIKNLFEEGAMEFSVNSKFFNENINLNGSIDANQSLMPITAECVIKEEKAKIVGIFNLETLNFVGDINYQGNAKHLSNFFSSVPQGFQSPYNLITKITINKESILLSKLNFSMDKILVNGEGSYNFKDGAPTLNLNVMPGNIVVGISNDQLLKGYKINIKAQNFKSLLEELQIDSSDLPIVLSDTISFGASATYAKDTVDIKNISLLLGEANLKGNITINWLPKLNLSYNLETNKGSALMNLWGIKSPIALSEVKIKGETSEAGKIWQTDTYITLSGVNTHIVGKVDTASSYKPYLTITATGNNLGNSLKQLFNQKTASPELGSFSISNIISGQMPIFEIVLNKYDVVINNAKMSLNGKANIDLTSKPKIILDLVTSEINLNHSNSQDNTNNKSAGLADNQKTAPPWSKEKIDLSFLNAFDGNLTISIPKFIIAPLNIDTIKSKLELTNGKLSLGVLSGHIYGGTIDMSGHVIAKTGEMLLNSELKQAKLKDVMPNYKAIKITEGNFNLSSKLQSFGTSEYQYVSNLAGNINIVGTEGKISGINLQKVLDGLNSMNDLTSIANLLNTSFSGGQTAFNNVEANVIFKQGIGTLTHFKLDAPEVAISAEGNINLPQYNLDVNSTVKVERQKLPPFNVRLYGSLDNIQRKVDATALKQYLVENVLVKALDKIQGGKGGAGNILKNIMGSGQQSDSSSKTENSPEGDNKVGDPLNNAANKLIKKGLGNLFSK